MSLLLKKLPQSSQDQASENSKNRYPYRRPHGDKALKALDLICDCPSYTSYWLQLQRRLLYLAAKRASLLSRQFCPERAPRRVSNCTQPAGKPAPSSRSSPRRPRSSELAAASPRPRARSLEAHAASRESETVHKEN